jgi:hypothetical protein
MYRQGDLLFVQLNGRKPEVKEVIEDGVIARGESTGHVHRIAPEDLAQGKAKVYFMEQPRRIVIEAYEQVRVLHEEHKPIVLEKGLYEVRQQREYTPEAPRYVAD